MPLVLTMDPITAVGDHTVAATISLAGGITTTITDGTISTATTSALIIFMAAAFMVVVVAFMAAATVRDQLLLIRCRDEPRLIAQPRRAHGLVIE